MAILSNLNFRVILADKHPQSGLGSKKQIFGAIIQFLEPKILNEKFQVLFYKIKKSNNTLTFPLNILVSIVSKYCMVTPKYLFDRTKSGI